MDVKEFKKSFFKDKKFTSKQIMRLGMFLKQDQIDEAKKYAEKCEPYDIQPPVRCNIMFVSRPFDEWDYVKCSKVKSVLSCGNRRIRDILLGYE